MKFEQPVGNIAEQEKMTLTREAGRELRQKAEELFQKAEELRREADKLMSQAEDAEGFAAAGYDRQEEMKKMGPDELRAKIDELQSSYDSITETGMIKGKDTNTVVNNKESSLAFFKKMIEFGKAQLADKEKQPS